MYGSTERNNLRCRLLVPGAFNAALTLFTLREACMVFVPSCQIDECTDQFWIFKNKHALVIVIGESICSVVLGSF